MSVRIAHVITRMILGGAQENTLLTCRGLHEDPDYDVHLVTGPAIRKARSAPAAIPLAWRPAKIGTMGTWWAGRGSATAVAASTEPSPVWPTSHPTQAVGTRTWITASRTMARPTQTATKAPTSQNRSRKNRNRLSRGTTFIVRMRKPLAQAMSKALASPPVWAKTGGEPR